MQRPTFHNRSTRVAVRPAQHQEPAHISQRPAAGNHPCKTPAAGHRQTRVADRPIAAAQAAHRNCIAVLVEDATRQTQRGIAREHARTAQSQRATVDQRRASIGFIRGQHCRAAPALNQRAGTGDQVGNKIRVAAVKDQVGTVGHIPRAQGAADPIRPHLQRAAIDQRRAAIRIGSGQHPGPTVGLAQPQHRTAAVANHPSHRTGRAAATQNQIRIAATGIGDRTRQGQLAIGHHHRAVPLQRHHPLDRVVARLVHQPGRAVVNQEPKICSQGHVVGEANRADVPSIGRHNLLGAAAKRAGVDRHYRPAVDVQIGREGIHPAESHRPTVNHADPASPHQPIANRVGIAAGKYQLRVVGHRPGPQQAARAALAHLQRPAIDDHQAAVGVIAAEHHHRRQPGLGQAASTTQDPRQGQRPAARGARQHHIPAQHHIIGDHKTARAILRNQRRQSAQRNTVARDELRHPHAAVGQVDLFGNQTGQIVLRRVAAIRRPAKGQNQIGGANRRRRHDVVLPLAGRAKAARSIAPCEAAGTRITQDQIGPARRRQTPGPIVDIGEASKIQAQAIGENPAAGSGNRKAVVAVLVEVDHRPGQIAGRQRNHINHERIAAGRRVGPLPVDLQQIPPAGTGRAVEFPQVIATATQAECPRRRQRPRPSARPRRDRPPTLNQHARRPPNTERPAPSQGRLAVGHQQVILHKGCPTDHGEPRRAKPIPHNEVGPIAEGRVVDRQRPGVEGKLPPRIHQEVRHRQAAPTQRQGPAIHRQVPQRAATAGDRPSAAAHLAQRASPTQGPAKIRAHPAKPNLNRARADADLTRTSQQPKRAVILEVESASPADGDHGRIADCGDIGPVERAATAHRQITAAQQLPTDGQIATADQRVTTVGIRAAQKLRAPPTLGQRSAPTEIAAVSPTSATDGQRNSLTGGIGQADVASASQTAKRGCGKIGKPKSAINHIADHSVAQSIGIAREKLSLLDNCRAGVGIGATEYQCIGTGLRQAVSAADGAIDFHQAGVGSAESRVVAQNQIVGDHKGAGPVLQQIRRQTGQREAVADDELSSGRTVGQHDPFGDQTSQVIAGGVRLAADATEVEDHVGRAGRRRQLVLPIRVGGERAGSVVPDKIRRADVAQQQVAAGGRQRPDPVVGVQGLEAGQVEPDCVGIEQSNATTGGGDSETVIPVATKVGQSTTGITSGQRPEGDDKWVAGRGGIAESAGHL